MTENSEISVNYQKSNHFRVVLSEGCYGGISPRGLIRSAFYNERGAIPDDGQITLTNGQPVSEKVIKGREGLVREVEVEVVMDLSTGLAYHAWLGDKLEALRLGMNIPDEEWNAMQTGIIKTSR